MLRSFYLATIATVLSVTGVNASSHDHRQPRLVVGIIVEGLNQNDINAYNNSFTNGGIKHFLNNGLVINALQYPECSTRESATAILLTGASPSVNGITGPLYYDRSSMRTYPAMHDAAYMGNFTDETLSPAPLRVTTVADELRMANDSRSRVYAICADPATAIVSAGHLGNSAVWINDKDGRWSSSTYYKELPSFISTYNYKQPLSNRLDTITWSPSTTTTSGVKPFKYYFPRNDASRYAAFKASPRGNDDITALAIDYLDKIIAKDNESVPHMLTVGLTVAQYPFSTSISTANIERLDAYQRLDLQISRILSAIDRTVGLDRTMVYIAGVPAPGLERPMGVNVKIPTGEFSPRRARALLNMHLTALYGSGEWVIGYSGNHFYLNNKLAEEHGISPSTLHATAAAFLSRMSGINRAKTIEDYIANDASAAGIDINTAGDVIVSIRPGWQMIETDNHSIDGRTVRLAPPYAPFYLLSPGIKPNVINTPVDARCVAPTLSGALHIRAPNAATFPSISY